VPPVLTAAELETLVLRLTAVTTRRDGFSRTAAATLSRLAGSGAARLTDLAVAEGVSQPSMSSLIARLVDQGLVRREPDPDDARAVRLSLTAAGDALVAERRTARTQRLDTALAELSADDVTRLADALPALTRLADALRRPTKEVSR
jgi:DNA-binding MarR family transcriptional regulator